MVLSVKARAFKSQRKVCRIRLNMLQNLSKLISLEFTYDQVTFAVDACLLHAFKGSSAIL